MTARTSEIRSENSTQGRGLPIVFSADENFSIPLGLAILSLLESAERETRYDIHVLDDGVHESIKNQIHEMHEKHDFSIQYHDVSNLIENTAETLFYPRVSFARFYIPEILPAEIQGNIFYSDADVLFCSDLTPLYKKDMTGKAVAAIQALNLTAVNNRQHLIDLHKAFGVDFLSKNEVYYQSGNLLFNREEWLKTDLTKKILKMARTKLPDEVTMPDQDIMNLVCREHITPIPPKYCAIPIFSKRYVCDYEQTYKGSCVYSESELSEALNNPAVIHFAGAKPIVYRKAAYKLDFKFIQFWAKSPWKNRIPYYPRDVISKTALPVRKQIMKGERGDLYDKTITMVLRVNNLVSSRHMDDFVQTVNSIHQQTYPHIEVFVIDEASTDGTVDLLQKWESSGVLRFKTATNNHDDSLYQALQEATGRFVQYIKIGVKLPSIDYASNITKKISVNSHIENRATNSFYISGICSDCHCFDDDDFIYSIIIDKGIKWQPHALTRKRLCNHPLIMHLLHETYRKIQSMEEFEKTREDCLLIAAGPKIRRRYILHRIYEKTTWGKKRRKHKELKIKFKKQYIRYKALLQSIENKAK